MKVAVLGYGRQGQSAADYWHTKGYRVTICDQNTALEIPKWASKKLGDNHLSNLDEFDLIVRSPIIHPNKIAKANNEAILKKVTSTTNEFFKVCPTKNIVGVTGTKGKGTTSTLIARILEADGKRVHLGGNIGLDPLLMLKNNIQENDWVVLELANFQLIDLKYSPAIAVCLMVVPEHLDWHTTTRQYYESKISLFAYQTNDDLAVYNARNEISKYIASFGAAKKIGYDVPELNEAPNKNMDAAYVNGSVIYYKTKKICSVKDVGLLGRHNLENVCAAISATWDIVEGNVKAITQAIKNFKGLEHRLEFVADRNGIKYYNDSFATAPEATLAAMKVFKEPKIMIVGGSDKGISLQSVIDEIVKSNVRYTVLIGVTADYFKKGLEEKGYHNFSEVQTNMSDIVKEANRFAKPGDIVLLSTACASFGMFKDYVDRGNQFKNAVLRS